MSKSLSYVYKSQFDQELSFRDTFEVSQELGSSSDSFVSAESDNFDDKDNVIIVKKKKKQLIVSQVITIIPNQVLFLLNTQK